MGMGGLGSLYCCTRNEWVEGWSVVNGIGEIAPGRMHAHALVPPESRQP